MSTPLQNLQHRLGYRFRNEAHLRRALTHRSASVQHNERLEFLGDSVVNMLTAEMLYERFEEAREGNLTRMRAQLVRGETLATVARELGVGACLLLGQGERNSGGAERTSILADALEAVIAAIYLDAGLETCRERIRLWFSPHVDALAVITDARDAKTRLQEWLQARAQGLPSYQVESVTGEAHNQHFVVTCTVEALREPARGEGGSRKQAEQAAAAEALKCLDDIQRAHRP